MESHSWAESAGMMRWSILVLECLFCIKLIWNVSVPYVLIARGRQSKELQHGISLMPAIEVILLAMTAMLSVLGDSFWPFQSVKWMLLVGAVAIVFSYVHLVIVGAILGQFPRG